MFAILSALGRIGGIFTSAVDVLKGLTSVIEEVLKFGVTGLGGVALKMSEKVFSNIENMPFFKKFDVNFGSKYMTPFGTTLYWNEIQQQIYRANRQLGIAGQLGKGLEKSIIGAGTASLQFGFSEKEIVENYKDFVNEYERNTPFSEKDLQRMTKINYAFDQSFNKIFAKSKLYGASIESTYDFFNKLNLKADNYGLTTKKVFNDIQNNFKLLNKYNFKEGRDGLAEMVITANKLGLQMESIAGFAEKVYDPEGAIDTAAQLQALGGQFAMLGDSFSLMYDANNDMEAFTKKLAGATKGMASLNKESGVFEISSLGFRQLRAFAQATDQSIESVAEQARLLAKEDFIRKAIPTDLTKYSNIDQFISKIASMSTYMDGMAKINIDGVEKLVSNLKSTDLAKLSQITVTPEGDSFDNLIKSNQTLGDKIAIFSIEFTRAINKFEYIGTEIGVLNELLKIGNESLVNGNLKNVANVINEAKKGSATGVGNVVIPLAKGDFQQSLSGFWENMNFKSETNAGTATSMTNLLGGKESGAGGVLNWIVETESALHDKISGKSSTNFFGVPKERKNQSSGTFTPSFGMAGSTPMQFSSSSPSTSFSDSGKLLKLYSENEAAKKQITQQLIDISKSELKINAANTTHKIEFSWNGQVYNTYDIFQDEKFKELLRKNIGDSTANALLGNFSNGGRNTKPLDTIPR